MDNFNKLNNLKRAEFNFENIKLKKSIKLLFIYYPNQKDNKIEIINDLYDGKDDVLFIKYEDKTDNNKIISWLNNDFNYISIIIDRKLSVIEYDNLLSYCRFAKSQERIMILIRFGLDISKKLLKSNIKFDERLIISYFMAPNKSFLHSNRFSKILYIPVQDFSKIKNIELSDVWFYLYVQKKFFSCASGRLRQISGTCYANAVLNSILLTKSLKGLFFLKLRKDLEKKNISLKDINRSINDTCASDKKIYVYRFLYNLICTDFRPTVKNYYKSNQLIKDPDNIMTKITKQIVDNDVYEYYSQIFSDSLFKDVFDKYYGTEYLDNPYRYYNKDLYFPLSSRIVHPIDKEPCVKIKYGEENRKYIERYDDYEPLACCMYMESSTIRNYHHLICGYTCDGKYMVYDSAINYIGEVDWTDYDKLSEFRIKLDLKNYAHFVQFVCVYYVKKDYIPKLEKLKLCP
jgi:hypothetical protein